jgi:hypothetical protein
MNENSFPGSPALWRESSFFLINSIGPKKEKYPTITKTKLSAEY